MNPSLKQSIWFIFILALLACSGWYFAIETPLTKLDAKTLSTTPDMFIYDLTVRKFDKEGLLINQLTSPFVQHFPQDNSHTFKTPHIQISQANEPDWDIRSLNARSIQAGQEITFTQQVVIHQDAGEKNQESTMTTEKIMYYPKEKKATTEELVNFEQPGNSVQSMGMTAYLAEKRIQLLHQARGKYVPKVG